MRGKEDEFEWLASEIASVRTSKYFVVEGPGSDATALVDLPGSYRKFVSRFGNARLYRQHAGYGLGVLARPLKGESASGTPIMQIGHHLDRPAFFRTELLRRRFESPVFESQDHKLVRVASGFAQWIRKRAKALRLREGKKKWASIQAGPAPFSLAERRVVQARKFFRWRIVGVGDDGNISIEVTNDSKMVLPFLTLGVRASRGDFRGRIWLPIRTIAPGAKALVSHPCYKQQLSRSEIELEDVGDPSPEERDHFWEFRQLKQL